MCFSYRSSRWQSTKNWTVSAFLLLCILSLGAISARATNGSALSDGSYGAASRTERGAALSVPPSMLARAEIRTTETGRAHSISILERLETLPLNVNTAKPQWSSIDAADTFYQSQSFVKGMYGDVQIDKIPAFAVAYYDSFEGKTLGTNDRANLADAGVPGSTIGYTYDAAGGINDGFYAIVTTTQASGVPSYYETSGTVTATDGNNFMIVNGTAGPEFYKSPPFDFIAPGTKYTISFNFRDSGTGPNNPNMKLEILSSTNQVLGTLASGQLTQAGQWFTYYTTFTASEDSNIRLKVSSVAPAGSGNDFFVDNFRVVLAEIAPPLKVNNITVNEGSGYAVFEIVTVEGLGLNLNLTGGTASLGTDFENKLEYYDTLQGKWLPFVQGQLTPNDGDARQLEGLIMQVRVPITNDTEFETVSAALEDFTLTASYTDTEFIEAGITSTGTGTIKDDGTGSYWIGDAITPATPTELTDANVQLDDDRPLNITNVTVNEGSPYAVFTVTGAANQLTKLSFADQNEDEVDLSAVQVYNGSAWVPYDPDTFVSLNGSGSLLVRVAISPEQEVDPDGPETFRLVATNTGGAPTDEEEGIGTIKDDGTGDYWIGNSTTPATPEQLLSEPSPIYLDDDRVLEVDNVTVNEGSPWAVFTVSGGEDQQLRLSIDDQGGEGQTTGLSTIQYFDGTEWKPYTANSVISLIGESLLVRVAINPEQEDLLDGPETFRLVATNTGGGSSAAADGIGTVVDNGTGSFWVGDSTEPAKPEELFEANIKLDDDRTINVNSITVNEGSPWAVFEVTGPIGGPISFNIDQVLGDGSTELTDADIEIFVEGEWVPFTGAAFIPSAEEPLFVRVAIDSEQEKALDSPENFRLEAINTAGKTSADDEGIATIFDDGTGSYWIAEATTPATPAEMYVANLVLDDDRRLEVNDVTVNEGSPFAIFTVGGAPNQKLYLSLADQDEDGNDLADLQYYNGIAWVDYIPGSVVSLDEEGNLPVRVAIAPENEIALDGPETFSLVATNTGGSDFKGEGTIVDDGTGDYWIEDALFPATPGELEEADIVLDDDRPLLVNNAYVNEGSPYAVFAVSGAPNQLVSLRLEDQNDDLTDLEDLQYFDGTGWVDYVPGTLIRLDDFGNLPVRVALSPEQERNVDGLEKFSLFATNTGGGDFKGRGTIADDGTGSYWIGDSIDEAKPEELVAYGIYLDDDRTITVSDILVNEGSPYGVFTLKGGPGQEVKLDLMDGTANGNDYVNSLEYWDGEKWAPYTGGFVRLSDEGTLLVRNPILQDDEFEGDHTYKLNVTTTGGNEFVATATINDAGEGLYFPDVAPILDPIDGFKASVDKNIRLDNDSPFIPLVANDDIATVDPSELPTSGGLVNILDNDTFGGKELMNRQAFFIELVEDLSDGVLILNTENGEVTLGGEPKEGEYQLKYRVCELGRPENCAYATVTIVIEKKLGVADIAGNVWYDYREDGVWNHRRGDGEAQIATLEPAMAGWTLTLEGIDAKGRAVSMTATTSEDGTYVFKNVPEGSYRIGKETRQSWVPVLPLLLGESPWIHFHTVRVKGGQNGMVWNRTDTPQGNRRAWLQQVAPGSGYTYASAYLFLDTDMNGIADDSLFVSGPANFAWGAATAQGVRMEVASLDLAGYSGRYGELGLTALPGAFSALTAGAQDSLAASALSLPFELRMGNQTWSPAAGQTPVLEGSVSQLLPHNQRHAMAAEQSVDLNDHNGHLVARLVGMEFLPHYGVDFATNRSVFGTADGKYAISMESRGARHVLHPDAAEPKPLLEPSNTAHRPILGAGITDAQKYVRNRATIGTAPQAKPTGEYSGVAILSDIVTKETVDVQVAASSTGNLYGWVDFDKDGVWEASEQVFDAVAVAAGTNNLTFTVPEGVTSGKTWARFRLCDCPSDIAPTGVVSGGEVEDYQVTIASAGGSVEGTVWSDANADGQRGEGDSPMAGVTVFADLNANGTLDQGEPRVVTAADGRYSMVGVPSTTVQIKPVLTDGLQVTNIPGPYYRELSVPENGTVAGVDFGLSRLTTSLEDDAQIPDTFVLHGNFPNPFNPSTTLKFDLPQTADVSIQVVDALGRLVMDVDAGRISAGVNRTVSLDASRMASGIYLYRMIVKGASVNKLGTGKFTLIK